MMTSSKLREVKKPVVGGVKPPVFQSKGIGRRSVGASGTGQVKSGGLSPRSAVFSAGLAPPGHPDKKLMDEVQKLREERDKLNRSVAALKVQLSEKETEIRNLSSAVEQMFAMDVPEEEADDEEFMEHVMYLQNVPSKAAAGVDMMTFLQEWNRELLQRVSSQAFEIADLVVGGKDGKDAVIEGLTGQVKSLTAKLLFLNEVKGKSTKSSLSPLSSPPASPPHLTHPPKRSAATSYQSPPTSHHAVPPELKRLLSSIPPPDTSPDACTPYLSLLRDTASRLHITDPTDHPRPVNPKITSAIRSTTSTTLTLTSTTSPLPRRSASADRLSKSRGDSFQRTKSLGAKGPANERPSQSGQGSSAVSQPRGARLSKAATASTAMKQKHRNSISSEV
eukprot:TRINITY_DN2289_c0_g1_i1.p1 TRINITY_DN2289_c0_g1~~TRINITY_DN2289_c0_g1_i1.p1  ORF type:complete len:392 (+),score=29.32 TRINITY_DN2289_c0_g1_i1:57-1232(+)